MARLKRTSAIVVVGGVYRERCATPHWDEVFGSGGRAASSLAQAKVPVELHAYADSMTSESMGARAALEVFRFLPTETAQSVTFDYLHGLDTPRISAHQKAPAIKVKATNVVRFGMLEGDAIVSAERAVYDPQSAKSPSLFEANGSHASALALVLNRSEAINLTGLPDASVPELSRALRSRETRVVVIKLGACGAFVAEGRKHEWIPAYRSSKVWKIGSGDTFAAAFAYQWLMEGRSAFDSANLASRATSYYCETRTFADPSDLANYKPNSVKLSPQFRKGKQPRVYLAGPFFTLANLWMIEQVRSALIGFGLSVFSPYHDVGHGSADDVVSKDLEAIKNVDMVFAVGDGLDSGTVYEIGYARSQGKPVIVYCENETEENLKMMKGSGCFLYSDFVTAIYQTFWTAAAL